MDMQESDQNAEIYKSPLTCAFVLTTCQTNITELGHSHGELAQGLWAQNKS